MNRHHSVTAPSSGGQHLFRASGGRSVTLACGTKEYRFDFDPGQYTVLNPKDCGARALTDSELNAALDNPFNSPPLEELIGTHEKVLIVVPDGTRAAGVERTAPLLLRRLCERGLRDSQISVMVGGGIHRPPTAEEIRRILGEDVARRLEVHPHDANDERWLATLGVTSRGTRVELNRRLLEADHVIVVGAITFHYFAGFSGGRKAILPGCASERTIRANHLLSFDVEKLDKRVGVASGLLDGNAVHEDMMEAVGLLKPTFLVNTVVNAGNEITAFHAGHWRDAHRKGCAEYNSAHAVTTDSRRPVVLVSCGGSPRDINLIQSHKAIEHASAALEEGGMMVALADCPQGLGRKDFLDWFVPGGSRATALKLIDAYQINGQTAWGLRRKAERFRILLVSSLDAEVVRRMGLEPHPSLESALAELPDLPGYIIPNGLTTLPYLNRHQLGTA